jgi:hypothetical protein
MWPSAAACGSAIVSARGMLMSRVGIVPADRMDAVLGSLRIRLGGVRWMPPFTFA